MRFVSLLPAGHQTEDHTYETYNGVRAFAYCQEGFSSLPRMIEVGLVQKRSALFPRSR
jgi:hypothetical protein